MVKLGLGVVVAIACGACGKGKPGSGSEPTTRIDAPVVVVNTPPADAVAIDAAPRKPVQPWGPAGSCKLKVVGNSALDQPDGQANITSSFWYTEADRPKDDPKDSLLINCSGATLQLTIAQRGATVLGPKQYVNDKRTTDLSVQAIIDKVVVEAPMGTVNVTTFDRHHLSATLEITGKFKGRPVKMSGVIEFDCPGYAGCQ